MSTSLTLSTAAKNAAVDAVVDLVDIGSGTATAILKIKSGGGTVLAQLAMSNPAFGASSSGTATASAIADDTSADATGTAATFEIVNRDNTVVITGTCGTSGEALNLNTLSIVAGTKISISALTITLS
jgi:hypothetical protein